MGLTEYFRERQGKALDKVYEKAYEKVIDYIESNILDGHFEVGDKLPSERELSQMLSVSRNSVREGIRILEVIGVISSQHGIGNYIADHFDKTLVQVMTMMYALEKMTTMRSVNSAMRWSFRQLYWQWTIFHMNR